MLRAEDIMSRSVLTVDEHTLIAEAAGLMEDEQIGSLVITRNDMPVGIVTEADFTRRVAGGPHTVREPISAIMSAPIYYSAPDADIIEVANAMSANRIKKVPVLNEKRVLGIVTQTDVVRHVFRVARQLELEYRQGSMSASEFAQRFSSVFRDFDDLPAGATKNWHMRCSACGHRFLNPECDGELAEDACPSCGSRSLAFDQTPK